MKRIIIIFILLVVLVAVIFMLDFSKPEVHYGVSFSQQYAKDDLDLDWHKTYLAILDDLKVDNIRLSAYWDHNEPYKDKYNFDDLDWQINEASNRGVNIILAVGRRLPRWPECHDPSWIKDLSKEDVQKKQLKFIETVIKRYNDNPQITIWQIENEPYLGIFGKCPPLDKKFFNAELDFAKTLTDKPIMITDSGELSTWTRAGLAKKDILGTTLYRVVDSKINGYFKYPIPPSYYYFKSVINKILFNTKNVIVSELQTESWHQSDKNLSEMTLEEHFKSLSPKQMRANIVYAQKAGFTDIYLWGAEWWYFMKEQKGFNVYWEIAKKLWE